MKNLKEILKDSWYLIIVIVFVLAIVLVTGYELFEIVSAVVRNPSVLIGVGALIAVLVWFKVIVPKLTLVNKTERLLWIKSHVNLDLITTEGNKSVDKQYRIILQDEQYEKKIFGLFIEHMESFIYSSNIRKEFNKLSDEEYAMYFLYDFLYGLDARSDEIAIFDCRDDKYLYYKITEYGQALYRILYIAIIYCGQNENIIKHITHRSLEGYDIKEYLDTGYVKYLASL